MNPTWVIGYPTGDETGTYLALDMGGTNLRVCEVELPEEKGQYDIYQSKYRLPEEIKSGTGTQLFDYMAECVKQFLIANHEGQDLSELKELHLGFTFSYPCTQNAIDQGVLQRWTKGFDIDGVEGEDVVPMFEEALERKVGLIEGWMRVSVLIYLGRPYQNLCLGQRHHRHADCFGLH